MTNLIEKGKIVEGKVVAIQPYGAFVEIADNVQGLVHISEITHGYVRNINDHLSVGDKVKVKVLNVDESTGKFSLSIRATEEKPGIRKQKRLNPVTSQSQQRSGFNVLKEKLEEWIEQSSEREQTYRK